MNKNFKILVFFELLFGGALPAISIIFGWMVLIDWIMRVLSDTTSFDSVVLPGLLLLLLASYAWLSLFVVGISFLREKELKRKGLWTGGLFVGMVIALGVLAIPFVHVHSFDPKIIVLVFAIPYGIALAVAVHFYILLRKQTLSVEVSPTG